MSLCEPLAPKLSEILAPHLPYLRRFARAVAGDQKGGDAYAAATLSAIVTDTHLMDPETQPRVALYRAFLRIWNSISANHETSISFPSPDERASFQNLEALTPRSRLAFLLHALEEFTLDQMALALDCSVEEAGQLLDQAGQEIAEQIATDVLIIEDEPVIGMDLEAIVKELGHRVIGIARTHDEALHLIKNSTPGLILADLKLADGSSGLNAANEILETVIAPLIFITAFPEKLLTGAAPEPAFLVNKPFQNDTIRALISQALFFRKNAHPITHLG